MIRRAGPRDLDALASLEVAVFGAGAWSAAQLAAPLGDPDSLVLCDDGAPPSGAAILRIAADEVELLRIGVLPANRRGGLGSALLAEGLAWARARGAGRVFLEVARNNQPARTLYARHGFHEAGMRRDYYGPGRDAVILLLDLAEAL